MPQLSFNQVDYSVGGPLLLQAASFALEAGERIAVLGRNGCGKSTLLRLIAGQAQPDDGQIVRTIGLRIAALEQEVPTDLAGDVYDVVAAGAGELGRQLAEYHDISQSGQPDPQRLQALHEAIDARQGWQLDQRVNTLLQRFELIGETPFNALSGGLKRRVLLARAVVDAPDVLLLDEPTNHLDLPAIEWLQGYLTEFPGSVVFVTHDRNFLRALATRIIEIDRGQLSSWPGDYGNYLRRRDERLHAEAQAQALFDRRLAEEEVWIRQGIKARRTRNEGRVRALEAMRRERAQRRDQVGRVQLQAAQATASGKRVFEVDQAAVDLGGRQVLQPFSTRILRGDRVGIIGRNGAGKSTLLRLLLGQIEPSQGRVECGSGLQPVYFDQHRAQLREDWNALDNVSEGADFIEIGGRRVHVLGYLQDFLFTPERARAPITRLSGGERNRLLLAKLLAQPSNVLILDEPTNDLDIETLELLEELLAGYPGTILLVSHDRDFIDAVVTQVLAIDAQGAVREYVGGYSDFERQRVDTVMTEDATVARAPAAATRSTASVPPVATATRRKLSYKEQRELEALPDRIAELESTLAEATAAMNDPAFYRRSSDEISAHQRQLAAWQSSLADAYARWEFLEST